VRDIIKNLIELNDSIKADDIQSKLKTVKEDAIRQLKDKNELFVGGGNSIKLGNHQFLVNTQQLDVTTVLKGDDLYFHLTGTNFYERIVDQELESTRQVWNQGIISENKSVYRGEFLAYGLLQFILSPEMGLLHWIQLTD